MIYPSKTDAEGRLAELMADEDPDSYTVMQALELIWERLHAIESALKVIDEDLANWG